MKQKISLIKLGINIAILSMCVFLFASCAIEEDKNKDADYDLNMNPYAEINLDDYLTLPDYDTYSFAPVEYTVSEKDVNDEITKRLSEAGTTQTVTEGTVRMGDKITVKFSPSESEDGNLEGLSSESLQMVLGQEDMVEGFQEGISGHKIGESFTIEIVFPDPYTVKPEIAGKTIKFDVKVLNKEVTVPAKLDETFIKKHSTAQTTEEYTETVRNEMEKNAYEKSLQEVKDNFYAQLIGNVVMKDMPQDKVQEFKEISDTRYRKVAETYEIKWEDFLMQYFSVTPDNYDAYLLSYAREVIKQEMVLYAIAEREGIQITEDDYNKFLQLQLKNSGYKDEEAFEKYSGMSIREYVAKNHLFMNYILNEDMNAIYDRLKPQS